MSVSKEPLNSRNSMANPQKISNKYSPTDFMRARRPELFSDTTVIEKTVLDRSQFEFHLETLTQRKEEICFEHFCRRLAEKELCPNLITQTGPTGGGDSLVDTETYPVANSISERWYEGNPDRSSQERWAFAFSAKKTWRSKVNDDARKISKTKRGYSLIYFITNQAVRDRDRASVEDELRKELGIDVRILDRSWIVEKVVQNKRWDIVYQTLHIERPRVESKAMLGPLDTERQSELEELDRLIEDQARYQGSRYQLAEDCLQTALIARGLGRPRVEIDGRFDRAERIALDRDDMRQLFRILYHRAWTANWWFDDFAELDRLYKASEPLVINSEWVWDLEKLVNLWQVGTTWRQVKKTLDGDEVWANHTSILREALRRHVSNSAKPTSALWARTELVLMDLTDVIVRRDNLAPVLINIQQILKEAETHPDYPVEPIVQIIQELGRIVGGDETYDEVFEAIIQFQAKRVDKAEEGRMRLKWGYQKLHADKFYDAIDQFTKAQSLLIQNEHKGDFIQAVAGTALGYESAGLLWAARANLVIALDRTFYEYFKDGRIAPQALPLLRKLIWVEIQLGRVPCVFAWIELLRLINNALELAEVTRKNIEEEFFLMDAILGILVMRTRFTDWLDLDRVAGLMKRFSLISTRVAVLFSLGYEDAVRFELGQADEDLDRFFSLLLKQPAADDLPADAEWHLGSTVTMRTVLMGCQIELIVANKTNSIILGEAIFAFLESFLSNAIRLKNHIATRSFLRMEIRQSEHLDKSFTHRVEEDECGETQIIIIHPPGSCVRQVQGSEYQEALFKLLADFIAQLEVQLSVESIKKLFENDRAHDRAFFAAQSPVALTNILSENPKYHIQDWIDSSLSECFTLLRTESWKPVNEPISQKCVKGNGPFSIADGTPPAGLFGVDGLKHHNIQVLSPINMALWDKAKWRGLGFAIYPTNPPIPELVLMFEDIEAGEKIFRGWRKRFGELDREEWIGLTLITGIDRQYPAHYRVVISVNENFLRQRVSLENRLTIVFRMQDMTPVDNTNLERFLHLYEKTSCYRLSAGQLVQNQATLSDTRGRDLSIEKTQLRIVSAWQIGPNDLTSMALEGIHEPFIPSDVSDPPFFKAMERFSKISKK